MKKLIVVVVAAFFAQSTTSIAEIGAFKVRSSQENPEVVLKNGEIGRVVWKDGREAVTSKRLIPNLEVDVPAAIYENGCNGYIVSQCVIRPAVHMYEIYMQWSKHPDTSKIGKTLVTHEKKDPSDKMKFALVQELQFAFSKLKRPRTAKELPDDIIFCDDYKFLPRDPIQDPLVRILRWETEAMYPNPETGDIENRSISGAFDVDLVPQKNSNNLVMQVKGGYTSSTGSPFLAGGDIISWTMRNTRQEICQIGLKPNAGIFQTKLLEYLSKLPEKYGPYIFGTDEFSDSMLDSLTSITNNSEIVIE